MAHFLKGSFKGFYKAGPSKCVRDVFRFKKLGENNVLMEVTRRDMESMVGRYWRYENSRINLTPVDENEPRLGGKVQVRNIVVDFRTLTLGVNTQYGVYSDDFVTFGTFAKEAGNVLDDEETLLKIIEDPSSPEASQILDKTTFRFENNGLSFSKEVNAEQCDTEINHEIETTALTA